MNDITTDRTGLTVRGGLPADANSAFSAWVDSAALKQWMCYNDDAGWDFILDVREGGQFRIDMSHEGRTIAHTGVYTTIRRPERLAFTWVSKFTNDEQSQVTIDFSDTTTGSEILLSHTHLPEEFVEAHANGWSEFIDELRAWLSR